MERLDGLARQYVELTLIKHLYHDPWDVYWLADSPFWRRTALDVSRDVPVYPYKPAPALDRVELAEILQRGRRLYDDLCRLEGAQDGFRQVYLAEHTRALITRCRFLLGERMRYDEYTLGMFGLAAPDFDGGSLERALEDLRGGLPGGGTLEERMMRYRERIRVPPDKVPRVMNVAARFFQRASEAHMGLTARSLPRLRYRKLHGREFVTVLFGYDYDEVSLEMNFGRDFPFYIDAVPEIAGHEMEPGHFAFMRLRTKGMVDSGYPELGLNAHSPSSAFIEGGARVAVELALGSPAGAQALDRELLTVASMDRGLGECLAAWRAYTQAANYGKLAIERNLWDRRWTRQQALQFAKENHILRSDAGEEALDGFAGDAGHFTSHDYCRDVVRRYYQSRCDTAEEKWALYRTLCQIPLSMEGIAEGSFDPTGVEREAAER